jgi:hypothetical protein
MRVTAANILAVLVGCGGSNIGGGHIDAASQQQIDAPPGSNTITGMVNGTNFNTVVSCHWIGMPDSPTTDTVVYLFDRSVPCSAITAAGWDGTLAAGTQILELEMIGQSPASYPVTQNAQHIPAPSESVAAYTVAGPSATDNFATATAITLTTIGTPAAGHFASGNFQLTLAGGMLHGTYSASYCAAGREP